MAQEIQVTTSGTLPNITVALNSGSSLTTANATVPNIVLQSWGSSMTIVLKLQPGSTFVQFPTDGGNLAVTWGASGSPAGTIQYTRVSATEVEMVLPARPQDPTYSSAVKTYTFTVSVQDIGGTLHTSTGAVTLYQGFSSVQPLTATVSGTDGNYAVSSSPNTITVNQGGSLTLNLSLVKATGCDATVQFSSNPSDAFAWQGPAPVAVYSPNPVPSGGTSVTMTQTNENPTLSAQNFGFHVLVEAKKPGGSSFEDVTSTDPTLVDPGSPIG